MSEPFNQIKRIMAGLEIFLRHGGSHMQAEHDEVFSGPSSDGVTFTVEELATLDANGWRNEGDGSWAHFV